MNSEEVRKAQKQVDENYAFFKTQIAELKRDYHNKFALLHDQQISNFFDSEDDAINIGFEKYGEGNFSVQQVRESVVDLGYQSCVLAQATA